MRMKLKDDIRQNIWTWKDLEGMSVGDIQKKVLKEFQLKISIGTIYNCIKQQSKVHKVNTSRPSPVTRPFPPAKRGRRIGGAGCYESSYFGVPDAGKGEGAPASIADLFDAIEEEVKILRETFIERLKAIRMELIKSRYDLQAVMRCTNKGKLEETGKDING